MTKAPVLSVCISREMVGNFRASIFRPKPSGSVPWACPGPSPARDKDGTTDRRSAAIRKQLDRVAETAHRIVAEAFEIEIVFDEVGEPARQQHRSAQLLVEGFET